MPDCWLHVGLHMLSYEVAATVDARLVDVYERFMREHHIPALMATGCFRSAAFTRSAPGRYRMRYEATAREELDRYLGTHAARLREEFFREFPTGVTLEREVSEVLATWDLRAPAE